MTPYSPSEIRRRALVLIEFVDVALFIGMRNGFCHLIAKDITTSYSIFAPRYGTQLSSCHFFCCYPKASGPDLKNWSRVTESQWSCSSQLSISMQLLLCLGCCCNISSHLRMSTCVLVSAPKLLPTGCCWNSSCCFRVRSCVLVSALVL